MWIWPVVKPGLIAGQVQRQRGDLFRLAQPSHGLARLELRAGLRVVAIGMQTRLQRRRIHGARADGIAANALRDEIRRHRLREPDDRGLGGAIGAAIRHAGDGAGHRRHVDDRAAARGDHAGQERADHVVHGVHVELEGRAPLLEIDVSTVPPGHHARAVEQHVRRRRRAARTRLWRADRARPAREPRSRRACFNAPGIDVGCDHACAGARESFGAGAADARCRPR